MADENINSSVTPDAQQANSVTPEVIEENANPQVSTEKQPEMSTEQEQANVPEGEQQASTPAPVNDGGVQSNAETVEDLRRQLDEYKARDEELLELSQRLGTNNIQDPQFLEAQKQLDIVNNQAQQAYISLCNQFGVDYRPENIEKSANELKAKDPQAYYELQHRLGQLDNAVTERRNVINNFIVQKQTATALNKYNDILNVSPVLNQQLQTYLSSVDVVNPQEQIDAFMQMAMAVQREAFEYGKIYAQQQAINQQANPATVLNNSAMAQQSSFSAQAPRTFTREEIAKMSQDEFEKHEKEIDLAFKEGRIR